MKKSIITLLLLASGGAFANEAADELARRTAFAGDRTRAEVKAGIAAARAAGTLNASEYASNLQQPQQAARSRGELRAEAVQAARTRVIHEMF